MKKNLFLMIIISLLTALTISAQEKATDFSGRWELDVSKSKLDERARIESMTMNVAQTEKDIKIETTTKRSADTNGGGMNRGGGMFGDGTQTVTYTLVEGQALKGETFGSNNNGEKTAENVLLKAKMDGGKLNLSSTRTFNTQMGEMTIITNETWTLSDEGKTLTVKRETQTPRGANSSEMVFAKKELMDSPVNRIVADTSTLPTPKTISGGVLNGKATTLVKPKYPDEARAAKASGAVNVQITIDEQGNVISAKAVSGDSLLRAASEDAARQSKFAPTLLQGVPAKVTGVIIYNFVP